MKRLLLALFLLSACRPAPVATPTLAPPSVVVVTNSPLATATALADATLVAPAPARLGLSAPDGAELAASFYPPASAAPAPGVLLLHMLGGSRADWGPFAQELQKRGFAVLALDLRGHGDSAGPADWTKATGDVRAAWDALVARPEVEGMPSGMVGASIGANLALIVGANNPDVFAVAALSPGTDYHNLKPTGLLSNFGQRPVLLVASQDDTYAYDSARQMASDAAGLETHYLASAGHGTAMFRDPELAPLLLNWLEQHLGAKG